ncbi:hypothetical protein ACOXXX_12720 [Thalassococcus sp. BH17M4-6]|uniref:hypothetical protein n=1 Tax=Thalassococcus sp. BH17M4-6 TaxID=3413148 RepID=UPI003BDFFD0B
MTQELIKFWDEAPLTEYPYIHPQDKENLDGRVFLPPIKTFDEYQAALRERRMRKPGYQVSLLPLPYVGDVVNARFVILMLNPGLSANDFYVEHHVPEFRDNLLATIRQTRATHMFLDPKWAWTTAFGWWHGKVRRLVGELSERKFDNNYGRALDLLAREVACIELVPYHSVSFTGKLNLASTTAARSAAQAIAKDSGRTLIVTRSVKAWNLPDQPNVIKYTGGETRSASLGPNSKGGKAILDLLLSS